MSKFDFYTILDLDPDKLVLTEKGRLCFSETTPICRSRVCFSKCYWSGIYQCILKTNPVRPVSYTRQFLSCMDKRSELQIPPPLEPPIPESLLNMSIDSWSQEDYDKYLRYIVKTYTS